MIQWHKFRGLEVDGPCSNASDIYPHWGTECKPFAGYHHLDVGQRECSLTGCVWHYVSCNGCGIGIAAWKVKERKPNIATTRSVPVVESHQRLCVAFSSPLLRIAKWTTHYPSEEAASLVELREICSIARTTAWAALQNFVLAMFQLVDGGLCKLAQRIIEKSSADLAGDKKALQQSAVDKNCHWDWRRPSC